MVVTALAVMVAVAGYLNYSGMEFGKETATLGKVQEGAAAPYARQLSATG